MLLATLAIVFGFSATAYPQKAAYLGQQHMIVQLLEIPSAASTGDFHKDLQELKRVGRVERMVQIIASNGRSGFVAYPSDRLARLGTIPPSSRAIAVPTSDLRNALRHESRIVLVRYASADADEQDLHFPPDTVRLGQNGNEVLYGVAAETLEAFKSSVEDNGNVIIGENFHLHEKITCPRDLER